MLLILVLILVAASAGSGACFTYLLTTRKED